MNAKTDEAKAAATVGLKMPLVMGLDDDFNPRRLERYLALVQGDGITPVVVLTKVDIAEAPHDRSHDIVLEGRWIGGEAHPDIAEPFPHRDPPQPAA